jgi:site-specific DNA-methyltransferase (adenine-specific)
MKYLKDIKDWKECINEVVCGDCSEGMRLIPDNSIDLIISDPPYGMNFQSGYRKERHNIITNDNNLAWLNGYLQEVKRISKEDAHAYIFCSMHNVDIFVTKVKKYLDYKNIIIWEKNNTGMGDLFGDYAPKYEMIIFCSNGKKKLNGRRDPNIFKWAKTGNNLHPTEKPTELINWLIEKSTQHGDIVCDSFMGSWTTARACKDLGRNFIGFELEEKYCRIGEKRLEQGNLF